MTLPCHYLSFFIMFEIILWMFKINIHRQRTRNHSGNNKLSYLKQKKTELTELWILIKCD